FFCLGGSRREKASLPDTAHPQAPLVFSGHRLPAFLELGQLRKTLLHDTLKRTQAQIGVRLEGAGQLVGVDTPRYQSLGGITQRGERSEAQSEIEVRHRSQIGAKRTYRFHHLASQQQLFQIRVDAAKREVEQTVLGRFTDVGFVQFSSV